MPEPNTQDVRTGRSFDRLLNFTDAIVAVAITVLVLPIVDLRPRSGESTVWEVMNDNSGQLVTFAFTFVVVAVMWQVHNRIFAQLTGFDDAIFWLNLGWLLLIAFLPWSSSMYGTGIDSFNPSGTAETWFSGGQGLGGTGMLYWANLAVISFLGALITAHARRKPILIKDDAPQSFRDSRPLHNRGFVFGIYMLFIGVATLFIPTVAVWLPLGIIVIGSFMRRQEV